MKKWLEVIQIIVLLLICILFYTCSYVNKETNSTVNKIMETFQMSRDKTSADNNFSTKYFDVSANYYTYTTQEIGANPSINMDAVILNIGSAFGTIDINNIPWDTENKELTTSEALWGIVPAEASQFLFKKIYSANQFDSLDTLPFDDNSNKYHYEDPIFGYSTDNEAAADAAQAADALLQLVGPMAIMHAAAEIKMTPIEHAARAAARAEIKAVQAAEKIEKLAGMMEKELKPSVLNAVKAGLKNIFNAAGKAFEHVAEKTGLKAGAKAGKLFAKTLGKIASKLIAKMMALCVKFGISAAITEVILAVNAVITLGAGTILEPLYNFVIMPLMLCLTLPIGPVTVAMEHFADSTGCCPYGYTSLDLAIPSIVNMLISLIPIIGDIFSTVYDFVCVNDNMMVVPKQKLILPKYLQYQWLSSYHLEWPNYNCTGGNSTVNGKYWNYADLQRAEEVQRILEPELMAVEVELVSMFPVVGPYLGELLAVLDIKKLIDEYTHNTTADLPPQWTYGPYTNFNDIAKSPDTHLLIESQLSGITRQYDYSYIVPQGTPFFYCDFSDPNMLVQMAQFYYDNATRCPFPLDDGTMSIEFISKINYVCSSSLTSCDVLCELTNVKFNPINGEQYSESVTKGHDRRFYFKTNRDLPVAQYWEDTHDSKWVEIDDNFDQEKDNNPWSLNNIIHDWPFVNTASDPVTAELLITAYDLQKRSFAELVTASNNIPDIKNLNDIFAQETLNVYKIQYNSDYSNYKGFINTIMKVPDTAGANPGRLPPGVSSSATAFQALEVQLSTVTGWRDQYWEYQKSFADVTSNTYTQYTLYGCTHLDSTAGCALDPDVTQYDEECRKYVDFSVLPFLKRCTKSAIMMDQCQDISNITAIIDSYLNIYPNQRIKSIKHIVPLGQNACQYTWDEVTIDSQQLETNYKSNVINNILFQTDVSSCAFCLPKNGSNAALYGATVGGQVSATLSGPPTSVISYTHSNLNSNNQYYNPNVPLKYNQTFYYRPNMDPVHNNISNFTYMPNVDLIKRFNITTGEPLPDLTRPKRPIRLVYPQDPEKRLDNLSNDVCADPRNLKNIIMDFNNASTTDYILKITRAFTSASNVCDIEVDMMINNSPNIERRSMSITMKSNAESFQNFIPYTYDTIENQYGLNIRQHTAPLPGNLSTLGVGYAAPFLSNFTPTIASDIAYFNDDLIKNYGSTTQSLLTNTNKLLVALTGTLYLGDGTGHKKCNDPEIQQRIIEQYNIDNYPNTRYGVSNNPVYSDSMLSIVASATNSSNTCHLVFENEEDQYGDAYSPTTYITNSNNNVYDSNNYLTVNNLRLQEVQIAQVPGTDTFYPVAGQTYVDISATDLALSTQFDMESLTAGALTTPFVYPVRENCQVNCRQVDILGQAISDYQTTTNNTIDTIQASMPVGYNVCDYVVNNSVYNPSDGTSVLSNITGILRVTYTPSQYTAANSNCQGFSYTPASATNSNFEMQVAGDTVDANSVNLSPLFSYLADPSFMDSNNSVFKNFINTSPM